MMQQGHPGSSLLKALLLLTLITSCIPSFSQTNLLSKAFAHNDYWHKRPFYDAIENGYSYIEADVFFRGGKLIVAHWFPLFRRSRSLESLYLNQIVKLYKEDKSSDGPQPLTLMIDIKSKPEKTYRELKKLFNNYCSVLTHYENGQLKQGMLTVILTGKKPSKLADEHTDGLFFADDDLRKLNRNKRLKGLFVTASCKYSSVLKWKGKGNIPEHERERLQKVVQMAHSQGRKVRLWASPENNVVWQELLDNNVDLINTDRLADLRNFLLSEQVAYSNAKDP